MYITRHVETTVAKLSKMFGAILVAGPRQVGKTTMLKEVTQNISYATMDDLVMRASAQEESGTFFKDNPPPVFVDEIQKAPELFPQIKKHADPKKKDMDAFCVLDKLSGVKRGPGGVICLYDNLVTLRGNDRAIPIQYL